MRRRVVMVLLLLAGGIGVNVLVAWICVVWPGSTPGATTAYAEDVHGESDLSIFRYDHPRKLHIKAMAGDLEREPYILSSAAWAMPPGVAVNSLPQRAPSPQSLVPAWARAELLPWGAAAAWPSGDNGYDSRTLVAAGWPMKSMWASFDQVPNPAGSWGWKARHGIVLPDAWQPREVLGMGETPRCLGTRPIWSGLAINALIFAAVLWMLFAFPFAMRRRRRINRGLCPACAYPIGTSEVCTECGGAVPLRHYVDSI